MRRHNLQATGKGKARHFPRETVEFLLARQSRGLAPKSLNHYIRGIKGFTKWMSGRGRRLPFDPLEGLQLLNEREEVRHARRELTVEELRRVLDATRASNRSFRGLDGEARHALYLCAIGTGFRVSALAGLTPECFALDAQPPVITLAVRNDKSRRGKTQPVSPEVASLLRPWVMGKPKGLPLWPGNWVDDAAEMLRNDLALVGIPYTVQGVNGPEVADFHALRHSYITALGRKTDLRTVQELAGHSTPVLTARYMHKRQADLVEALSHVGGFAPPDTTQQDSLQSPCSSLAVTPDSGNCSGTTISKTTSETPPSSTTPNPLRGKMVEDDRVQLRTADESSPVHPLQEPGLRRARCLENQEVTSSTHLQGLPLECPGR
jgi:integrase